MIKKFDKIYLYTTYGILPAPKNRDTIILFYRTCYITHDNNIKLYYYLIFYYIITFAEKLRRGYRSGVRWRTTI